MVEQLLAEVKEKIEFAYADAVERQVEVPIVFILDVRDDDASWVAERFQDRPKIDEVIRESERRGTMPVLTLAVSKQQALLLVGRLSPESVAPLDNAALPETHFSW